MRNRYETLAPGYDDDEELDDYRQDDHRQGYDDEMDTDPYDLGYKDGFSEGYYAPHPGMGYGAGGRYAPQMQRYESSYRAPQRNSRVNSYDRGYGGEFGGRNFDNDFG